MRIPGWLKVVGTCLSVALWLIGIGGVPEDVRTWSSRLTWLNGTEGRWMVVGLGVIFILFVWKDSISLQWKLFRWRRRETDRELLLTIQKYKEGACDRRGEFARAMIFPGATAASAALRWFRWKQQILDDMLLIDRNDWIEHFGPANEQPPIAGEWLEFIDRHIQRLDLFAEEIRENLRR